MAGSAHRRATWLQESGRIAAVAFGAALAFWPLAGGEVGAHAIASTVVGAGLIGAGLLVPYVVDRLAGQLVDVDQLQHRVDELEEQAVDRTDQVTDRLDRLLGQLDGG